MEVDERVIVQWYTDQRHIDHITTRGVLIFYLYLARGKFNHEYRFIYQYLDNIACE